MGGGPSLQYRYALEQVVSCTIGLTLFADYSRRYLPQRPYCDAAYLNELTFSLYIARFIFRYLTVGDSPAWVCVNLPLRRHRASERLARPAPTSSMSRSPGIYVSLVSLGTRKLRHSRFSRSFHHVRHLQGVYFERSVFGLSLI